MHESHGTSSSAHLRHRGVVSFIEAESETPLACMMSRSRTQPSARAQQPSVTRLDERVEDGELHRAAAAGEQQRRHQASDQRVSECERRVQLHQPLCHRGAAPVVAWIHLRGE